MSWKEYLKIAEQAAREAGERLKAKMESYREIAFKGAGDVLKNVK
jgi:hypothetical protein